MQARNIRNGARQKLVKPPALAPRKPLATGEEPRSPDAGRHLIGASKPIKAQVTRGMDQNLL